MKAMRRWLELVVEPRRLLGLRHLPRYLLEWWRLRRAGVRAPLLDSWPQLGDRSATTPFDAHYFFQGAWLARRLAHHRPLRHLDVGSDLRVIGVLSGFLPTTFLDLRPAAISMPGLDARAGDVTRLPLPAGSLESVSCLHVVEHVGLGRYGDPLDPDGMERACRELVRVVAPGGRLYLSTPIGVPRVEFNAHRISAPEQVLRWLEPLVLRAFAWVDDQGRYHDAAVPADATGARYACGLFELQAPAAVESPAGNPGAAGSTSRELRRAPARS